ncbi:ectoine hydroxylase-related dioxygenase (phytanoyl-CoA dioxygenase family) [Flavobacterium araucananum]|uniref:Phytanoyl-CoA dioxygenase n=1 Tax=Flavobacterium araucananum TaxID=946678 RepID=A0A227PGQ7_9FLAO|nr:phytanoyl-CoA dioxygenase family protein [Flavobacterium araucananum]OXG09091.1 phytanoyl-CoA dioxygenase [Flavobacterium araucananum]PWJ99715.1 ectoine hydroxylase-related dioxygenase (phytanoyl-CoA dioxygenase family) [Flavobacterium araucananum]
MATNYILENLWKRTVNPSGSTSADHTNDWDNETKTLYQLGISLEDTLQYLYFEKPDFENFKIWITKRQRNKVTETEDFAENVLTKEDLEFWDKNGYIIVKNALTKQECEATQQAIWEYLEMDPNKKETWYNKHEDQKGLMLNFSDHDTLNNNRFSPKIKKAYEQLYNTTKIYKTIDKVSFNPPENATFTFLGSPLHWDTSLKQPIPFGLQGLLYLTDCGAADGAFHCVPGFHNTIEQWLDNLEPHENPRDKVIETLKGEAITGNAGDFIIWNNKLPHCATPNKGTNPRMVQYLTYLPDDYESSGEWV